MRLVPGWKQILMIAAPITLGAGALAAAYLYATSASATAANTQRPPANAALDVPPPAGLLVHVVGAAALSKLPNLAGRLKDGEQVKVAFAKTTSGTVVPRTNLNTATLDELEAIPGFSEAFAQDVIDYRTNFGGFQNTR